MEQLLAKCKAEGQPNPLEWLVQEMLDPSNPKMFRADCAKAAAPYIHRKMPVAIDGGEGKPLTVMNVTKLAGLSDDKLDQLIGIAREIADDGGAPGGEGAAEAEFTEHDVPGQGGVAS